MIRVLAVAACQVLDDADALPRLQANIVVNLLRLRTTCGVNVCPVFVTSCPTRVFGHDCDRPCTVHFPAPTRDDVIEILHRAAVGRAGGDSPDVALRQNPGSSSSSSASGSASGNPARHRSPSSSSSGKGPRDDVAARASGGSGKDGGASGASGATALPPVRPGPDRAFIVRVVGLFFGVCGGDVRELQYVVSTLHDAAGAYGAASAFRVATSALRDRVLLRDVDLSSLLSRRKRGGDDAVSAAPGRGGSNGVSATGKTAPRVHGSKKRHRGSDDNDSDDDDDDDDGDDGANAGSSSESDDGDGGTVGGRRGGRRTAPSSSSGAAAGSSKALAADKNKSGGGSSSGGGAGSGSGSGSGSGTGVGEGGGSGGRPVKPMSLRGIEVELPYFTKFLLLSAYIASFNSADSDARYFSRQASKRRRGGGAVAGKAGPGGSLLGAGVAHVVAKAFPLERLLAICSSLLASHDGSSDPGTVLSAELYSEVGEACPSVAVG